MYQLSYDLPEGSIYYRREEEDIYIVGYSGRMREICIPEKIDGLLVKGIRKKAFLGNRFLRYLTLPPSIESIEEWAFAHCIHLETVYMPKKQLEFGRGVFKECKKLAKIYIYKTESIKRDELGEIFPFQEAFFTKDEIDIAFLFAAVPEVLKAEYLLEPCSAGQGEWIQKWDARVAALLQMEDEEGYQKMVLCGEEDLNASLEEYVAEVRRGKARICFLRLMHPGKLSKNLKEALENYLFTHTKGEASEEAWEVLLKEHGDEKAYYELFLQIGCVTLANLDGMLLDMADRHAEMKAFLMNYKQEHMAGEKDFFDSLSLDW